MKRNQEYFIEDVKILDVKKIIELYKSHFYEERLVIDDNDSIKTKNFKKFADSQQYSYFNNALKNFTGIEASEILKIIFEQTTFKGDLMKKKIKMNLVHNYDMRCQCGYKEESFIHRLLFCPLCMHASINIKKYLFKRTGTLAYLNLPQILSVSDSTKDTIILIKLILIFLKIFWKNQN